MDGEVQRTGRQTRPLVPTWLPPAARPRLRGLSPLRAPGLLLLRLLPVLGLPLPEPLPLLLLLLLLWLPPPFAFLRGAIASCSGECRGRGPC